MNQQENRTPMFQYHTVAGGFVSLDKHTEGVIAQVRSQFERSVWNAGYTTIKGKPTDVLRDALNSQGLLISSFTGTVTRVYYHVNTDKGNEYKKCRIEMKTAATGEEIILTLDMGGEFTQRLIQKLEALGDNRDQVVTILPFQQMVERNNRWFCNHICSLKNENGEEIKALTGHSKMCQDKITAAIETLKKMGLTIDLRTLPKQTREDYHQQLLIEKVMPKWPQPEPVPQPEGDPQF